MLRRWYIQLRSLWTLGRKETELDDEIRFHIETEQEEGAERGLTAAAARIAAVRDFGNTGLVREDVREAWGWRSLERLAQDLRYGLRSMRHTPVISAVAILSLALGIGANTAIFSMIDVLLLRTLPVRDPQQLTMLGGRTARRTRFTNPIWEEIRDHSSLFAGGFAWANTRFDLAKGGQTEFVDGLWASGGMFEELGVSAVLGRTFTAADDRRGGGPDGPVAVISHDYWQRRFAGATDAIGRSITVERVPFTIIGVAPPEFFGVEVGKTFDIAIPIGTEPLIRGKRSDLDNRTAWWLGIMIRLKEGQSLAAANVGVQALHRQVVAATMPRDWRSETYLKEGLALEPAANGWSSLRILYLKPMLILMVVVALVLLIACANIANLLLARAVARQHELSLRVALGASRWRIARQLLSESLLLSGFGALVGLVFARIGGVLLIRQLSSVRGNVFLTLPLDWRILGFTTGVSIVTAVLFGTVPAFRATRVQPADALKTQGRGVAGDGRFPFAHMLVVLQVALSLILVVAAGLFMRTFTSLAHVPLGFSSEPVMVANIALPVRTVPAERAELFRKFLEAANEIPGVASAALSDVTPVSNSTWNGYVEVPDGPPVPESKRLTYYNLLSVGWFQTYGIPLFAGRDFTSADVPGSPREAIVNETFMKTFAPGRNPIGLRVRQPGHGSIPAEEFQVVGYVKDAVYESPREPVPPTLYFAFGQQPASRSAMSLSVRVAGGSPALLIRPLAAALTQVNGDIAITFRSLAEQVSASLLQERLVASLSAFFGVLALLLAGLGLYGVTSYSVSRRRNEIGIRMALGAAPNGVVTLVLGRVAVLIAVGVVVGAAVSLWASQFVSTLLFGLQPRDSSTLIGAVVILGAVGAAAGLIPAQRASRIDPAGVLRGE